MRFDLRFILLLLCFFLSGFAALLYETAWAREFAFVFGTSEFAVVSVLAAYMGGLAAGAAVAARLVSRIRRPILVYAIARVGHRGECARGSAGESARRYGSRRRSRVARVHRPTKRASPARSSTRRVPLRS